MKSSFYILWAEIKKAHFLNFHSIMIYFSLLIWPIVMFFSAYYSFKPFNTEQNSVFLSYFSSENDLVIFLLIGYLGYIFYFSMVQSAFQMSRERVSGTLEIIFLSPVSRISTIYGRAMGNLLEGGWLFLIFVILSGLIVGGFNITHWWDLPLSFILLVISSVIWGGFVNSLLLFSRDSGIFYEVLQEPLLIFSGVRIPSTMLPIWGRFISILFPLTFVLKIFRDLTLKGYSFTQVLPSILMLIFALFIYFLLTCLMIKKAEKNSQENGSFALF